MQKMLYRKQYTTIHALSESEPFTSAGRFAECLFSGSRQRKNALPRAALGKVRLSVTGLFYRVQDTGHRSALGKDMCAECQTLGKQGARQRAVSGRPKVDGR
jgi:hypothetical protein